LGSLKCENIVYRLTSATSVDRASHLISFTISQGPTSTTTTTTTTTRKGWNICTISSIVRGGLQWRKYWRLNSPLHSSLRVQFECHREHARNCIRDCIRNFDCNHNCIRDADATDYVRKRYYNMFAVANAAANASKLFVLI
jgi:hypothetical protein